MLRRAPKHQETRSLTVELYLPVTEVPFTVTVESWQEDQGIGPYEFWGAKGSDHHWVLEWEITNISDQTITKEMIYQSVTQSRIIQDAVEALWNNQPEPQHDTQEEEED